MRERLVGVIEIRSSSSRNAPAAKSIGFRQIRGGSGFRGIHPNTVDVIEVRMIQIGKIQQWPAKMDDARPIKATPAVGPNRNDGRAGRGGRA